MGAATAYHFGSEYVAVGTDEGCGPLSSPGVTPATPVSTDEDDDGERRSVKFAFPAGDLQGGALDVCVPMGEIVIDRALAGDSVEIEFIIRGQQEAVRSTLVQASGAPSNGRLVVGAWVAEVGEVRSILGSRNAKIDIIVRVPSTGAFDTRALVAHGDVRASGFLAGDLELRSSFGDAIATSMDLTGNATVTTSHGSALLEAISVQTGRIAVGSDFGDVDVSLPLRADVGYDAHATTDFGKVTLRIGETEDREASNDYAGGDHRAKSAGYATKPTRVEVKASSSHGNVRVVAS